MPAQTYNDWTLVSLSPLPAAVKLAAALLVVLALGLVLWSYVRAKRRWLLTLLRVATGLLVLGFVCEPALQLRVVRKVKNRVAIIVDQSQSMGLATDGGRTRYEQVRAILQASGEELRRLGDAHVVEWFNLEGRISAEALAGPPDGERTDLLTALEKARQASTAGPLAGIVLLSDGADNVALEASKPGVLSEQAVARLTHLGVPVSTVNAAASASFKDLAITDVIADEFAFVHNTFSVEVRLQATGYDTLTLPVTLRREGAVVATQQVAVGGGEPASVTFKTKPDEIGEFIYSVGVPLLAGEAVASNNERTFALQVVRDKIRVLQVAGRPSWDERFLRQHLKQNPNVDLISFFILRTPEDMPGAPERELSLIPFPVEKLFTTELRSFDVVIFQNFAYGPYHMEPYLENIADAVRGGLGFVMLGGDESFSLGGYRGTPIADILPVTLDLGGMRYAPAPLALTTAGRRHPATDLTHGEASNERLWQKLSGWSSFNLSGGLAPGATALVVHPQLRGPDTAALALIAVRDVGQGRSMAVATDTMWRWRFSGQRDGGASERAYHRFWSSALRWLVRDPEHARVRVLPDKRRHNLGEDVEVSFVVRGNDYQPVPFAHLRVRLEASGGTSLTGARIDEIMSGEGGVAKQRYTKLPAGAYRVTAEARASGEDLGRGGAVFVVAQESIELSRAAPRPDLLRAIAERTRGNELSLEPRSWREVKVLDPEVVEVDRRRNVELWDNGWALAAAVLLFAVEWAVRRRSGYL